MAIKLTHCDETPICRGHAWSIIDEDRLAKLIAHIASGYHRHVAKLLRDSTLILPEGLAAHSLERLIERLGPPATENDRYHRDGWAFQMISWIAANLTTGTNVLIAPPQPRPADKGFDGLMIELAAGKDGLVAVVICEDKATENARKTITDKVWPELVEFEDGQRDAELQSEVTSVLTGVSGGLENIVAQIHWSEQRRYRVSVTVPLGKDGSDGRKRIFKGFEENVRGGCERRQGECIAVEDVRHWMDELCVRVVEALKTMPKPKAAKVASVPSEGGATHV